MSKESFIEKLGAPDVKLCGLSLWVHGLQNSGDNNSWDGDWLNATALCESQGVEVLVSGPIFQINNLKDWIEGCERMKETLSGEAVLGCAEPDLYVSLEMGSLGHITMTVDITPDALTQEHRFEFEIDQSYLKELLDSFKRLRDIHPFLSGFR
jgi:hypothetical protein